MCGESHGELVRQWLYSHIAMLAEHQDISGSFMFLLYNQSSVFIRIIRVRKKNIRVIRGKRKNCPVHTRNGSFLLVG